MQWLTTLYAMKKFSSPSGRPHLTAQGFGLSPEPAGSEAERAGLTRSILSGCSASVAGNQATERVNTSGTNDDLRYVSTGHSKGHGGTTTIGAEMESFPSLPQNNGTSEKEDIVPRFLVLKRKEGDFTNVSPFLISKTIYGIIGNVKEVKKVKGELCIETVSSKQSKQMLKCERFAGFEIVVEPHKTLNTSRGVVFCRDLLNCSLDEIRDNLSSQGVIDVRRIRTRRDGEFIDTANHVLTFNSPKLPRNIQAAFYPLQVRPYIPNPLRCFNCQRFGHSSTSCKYEKRCVCGKPPHDEDQCEIPIECPNCKGPHKSITKTCPVYRQESKIQEVKVIHKLTYIEAKKKVDTMVTPSTSFAQVASVPIPVSAKPAEPEIRRIIKEEIEALKRILTSQNILVPSPQPVLKVPIPVSNINLLSEPTTSSELECMDTETRGSKRKTSLAKSRSRESSVTSVDEDKVTEAKQERKRKPGWPKGKPRKPRNSGSRGSCTN
ncbi:uncharacterized protein LOC116163173 [Photinus pyralis]|uniref:uncharacterized protein LOC116163173 n=1 Tax=Photinus pyralis TaxID=7054 RepID=UPI0012677D66|nr:uncharacterized protein LOC116163173 [Photinus pyralis]